MASASLFRTDSELYIFCLQRNSILCHDHEILTKTGMMSLGSAASCAYIWNGWEKANEFEVEGSEFSNDNEVSNKKLILVLEG